jgi:cytosine/adenosine deaminase-related metal-dependent hydrolase
MSAILLAVFDDYAVAERVRTRLVSDGFPTDRVELTARAEKGRAAEQPGASDHTQFTQYFRTLLSDDGERGFAEELATQVDAGTTSTVAVHPRGEIETGRAVQLLERAGARELLGHDLQNQAFEHAASDAKGSWVRHLMPARPPAN